MTSNAATQAARLSVAPMMDWTDRHCRVFHRLMSREALLYTEMVTAAAITKGDALHLLDYDVSEHPVALQLGGSDASDLSEAVKIAATFGYDEINLNVGCPSDRVQSGCFGAVLMRQPDLVADCVKAMQDQSPVDVTVKCRIGVDEQDPEVVLPRFLEAMAGAGVKRMTVHARKAWLEGLSPKQNRDVPPLDYPLVYRMKTSFPDMHLSINGGVMSLDEVEAHLAEGMDGVMVGRAAYHSPADLLLEADTRIFGKQGRVRTAEDVAIAMLPYIETHLATGGRLNQITRHMLGLFAGRPGARGWKRTLSEQAHRDGAGPEVILRALDHVTRHAA